MQAAVRACARGVAAPGPARAPAPVDASWAEPTAWAPEGDDPSDLVPVSVVFETSESSPDSIVVEISDGAGQNQKFELQTGPSVTGVDELLELPPASVVFGRRGT
jgi:hypothetical protein